MNYIKMIDGHHAPIGLRSLGPSAVDGRQVLEAEDSDIEPMEEGSYELIHSDGHSLLAPAFYKPEVTVRVSVKIGGHECVVSSGLDELVALEKYGVEPLPMLTRTAFTQVMLMI